MLMHSSLLNRSKRPSDASSTKWSFIGSIVITNIYSLRSLSYLGLNENEVLYFFRVLVHCHFYVFAVEVSESARHRQAPEHAPEHDVASLLLDSLLLVWPRGLVIYREVYSLSVPAEDSSCVAHVCAYENIVDDEYHDGGRSTLEGCLGEGCFVLLVSLFEGRSHDLGCCNEYRLGVPDVLDAVNQSASDLVMEVVPQKLGALCASVAIEYGVVSNQQVLIDVEILHCLVRVLHVRPLPDV